MYRYKPQLKSLTLNKKVEYNDKGEDQIIEITYVFQRI